jgi:hypothetical protein
MRILRHFVLTRNSRDQVAHHPRIDVTTQHDREDLIRQAQQLASKPSQLIPAKRWPPGFNAGLAEHAVELTRTRTAGRGMAHQRTRQALCRPVITAIADTVQTHESVLRDIAAFTGIFGNRPHDGKSREGLHARAILLVPTLEVRKTRVCARGNDRTAGETYEAGEKPGLSLGPLSISKGVGRKTGSLGIFDLRCQFRGGLSQNLRHRSCAR